MLLFFFCFGITWQCLSKRIDELTPPPLSHQIDEHASSLSEYLRSVLALRLACPELRDFLYEEEEEEEEQEEVGRAEQLVDWVRR